MPSPGDSISIRFLHFSSDDAQPWLAEAVTLKRQYQDGATTSSRGKARPAIQPSFLLLFLKTMFYLILGHNTQKYKRSSNKVKNAPKGNPSMGSELAEHELGLRTSSLWE